MADESFYSPGERRASSVNALFDAIARRYDLMNDLQSFGLHRAWKRRLLRLANPMPGESALDICCGTGDIAIATAKCGATVVGIDFSQQMLAVAQARSRKRFDVYESRHHPALRPGLSGVENSPDQIPHRGREQPLSRPSDSGGKGWGEGVPKVRGKALNENSDMHAGAPAPPQFLCGDAMRLPIPDESFEIVTTGYGLRNLADWETGLREMQRVAKPGGRLLVLDFGKPDNAIWRAIYFGYLKAFVPVLGRLFAGSAAAYSYILESLASYPAQHGVAAKMREIGLAEVRVLNLLGGIMSIHYGEKRRTTLPPSESRCHSENTLSKMPG